MFDFVIYICSNGEEKEITVGCFETLRRKSDFRYDKRTILHDALIGRSRSRAATQFLAVDDSPYMIFVDDDIAFEVRHIEMILQALQAGYPVVGGAYPVADGSYLAIQPMTNPVIFDGGIYEYKYVSSGFMGISRKCLETVRDKCPYCIPDYEKLEAKFQIGLPKLHLKHWAECYPFFESYGISQEGIYISEDWEFCLKVRRSGMKVWLKSDALVGHIKERLIPPQEALDNMVKADIEGKKRREMESIKK